jgi:hypothetical protein
MFALLVQVLPGMTLKQWGTFAAQIIVRREIDGSAGAITIENNAGTIRGCFIYEVARAGDGRSWLNVRHVVVPALGQAVVADMIRAATETIARTQGCDVVRFELPTDAAWEADFFSRRGHLVCGIDVGDAARLH